MPLAFLLQPASQFASTAVCCWRRHRLASHQCIKLKNRQAGGRPLVRRTVSPSGAYLVAGQIEHAQEPAGGFCVDEDWAAAVELGRKGCGRLEGGHGGQQLRELDKDTRT